MKNDNNNSSILIQDKAFDTYSILFTHHWLIDSEQDTLCIESFVLD